MKIYVMDGDYLTLKRYEASVKKASPKSEITFFTKAGELIAAAQQDKPDVVFLDADGENGTATAKKLSEICSKKNIILASKNNEKAVFAAKMFASGYITKPFTDEAIKSQLANLRHPVLSKILCF